MAKMKRLITAILVGAALGIATEYLIKPLLEKPVKEAVEKVVA